MPSLLLLPQHLPAQASYPGGLAKRLGDQQLMTDLLSWPYLTKNRSPGRKESKTGWCGGGEAWAQGPHEALHRTGNRGEARQAER